MVEAEPTFTHMAIVELYKANIVIIIIIAISKSIKSNIDKREFTSYQYDFTKFIIIKSSYLLLWTLGKHVFSLSNLCC